MTTFVTGLGSLARADLGGHGARWRDDRCAPHLARSRVGLQSAGLDARAAPWACCSATPSGSAARRRHDRRRRAGNDPLASAGHALDAGGGRALGQPPRRARTARRFYDGSTSRETTIPQDDRAVETLADRARAAGVEALTLVPALDDFNEDLRRLGAGAEERTVRSARAGR